MFDSFERIKSDCVIVGGGAAGVRAAIACQEAGLDTLLLMKSILGQSHSLMAEGGVNAAIGQNDPTDNWQSHYDDTMAAGRFINHRGMVELLCKESPQRMYDLLSYGAGFETDSEGKIIQLPGHSGGQTKNRVISLGDFIGFIIQRSLMTKALELGIRFVDETICLSLLSDEAGEACGVFAYNLKKATFVLIEARSIILACGGGGRVFGRTTNPIETTGEAYVLGLEAGIEIRDIEMVQFHPTSLCWPPSAKGVLVTEAARAAGGRLFNALGERFMERYDAGRLELAPRDIVARSIMQEIAEGRGTEHGGVFLDLSHLDQEVVLYILQNTVRVIKAYQNIDVTRERIEVRPAAHHFMGGLLPADIESMEAKPGVFLAGEISWGAHGANRLGGNSLAETQVFGARAGQGAVSRFNRVAGERAKVGDSRIKAELANIKALFESRETADLRVYSIRKRLGDAMDEYVGVVRSDEGLRMASRHVEVLEHEFHNCKKPISNYHSVAHIFECSKMLALAKLIIQSALFRNESRGAHLTKDYPMESAEPFNTYIGPQEPYTVNRVNVT